MFDDAAMLVRMTAVTPADLPPPEPVRDLDLAPRQLRLVDDPDVAPSFDRTFTGTRHVPLSRGAWVDVTPGFVAGAEALFETVASAADWHVQHMVMFEQVVRCPRLSTSWTLAELPSELSLLRAMAAALSQRHRVALTRVSANLYRDGRDAVAWHGDRGARDVATATVAVLTLGATRPFRLRERDGRGHVELAPASGDLLVMGGSCQRTWQHAVPRVADAGARISVMFRPATW
jgi:alkylated DNA repair dioxygenase AlkB